MDFHKTTRILLSRWFSLKYDESNTDKNKTIGQIENGPIKAVHVHIDKINDITLLYPDKKIANRTWQNNNERKAT